MVMVDNEGDVYKQIHYSPYGDILNDSNPGVKTYVGYFGGLWDPGSEIVFIKGRPYHYKLHHWLTADWKAAVSDLKTPEDFYLYRFNYNDPVNKRKKKTTNGK